MNTRKFSRSMEEAFGPGHRGGIYTKPEPMHPADRIIVASCCVVLLVVFALFVVA